MSTTFLTNEQVHTLNEKHGWFQYRDAQSDVSRAFAQDAIAMHERIRAAAPELLMAADEMLEAINELMTAQDELDNRELNGPNAEDYFVLLHRRNATRRCLDQVIDKAAKVIGSAA